MENDLDEDVDNKMNVSDAEFSENNEVDYNSCSVANAFDIMVPAANLHRSWSGNSSFNCSAHSKKNQPSRGGIALISQVIMYNMSL